MKRSFIKSPVTASRWLNKNAVAELDSFKSGYDFIDSRLFANRFEDAIDSVAKADGYFLEPASTKMYFVSEANEADHVAINYDEYCDAVLDIARACGNSKTTFKSMFRDQFAYITDYLH